MWLKLEIYENAQEFSRSSRNFPKISENVQGFLKNFREAREIFQNIQKFPTFLKICKIFQEFPTWKFQELPGISKIFESSPKVIKMFENVQEHLGILEKKSKFSALIELVNPIELF